MFKHNKITIWQVTLWALYICLFIKHNKVLNKRNEKQKEKKRKKKYSKEKNEKWILKKINTIFNKKTKSFKKQLIWA